MKIPCYSLIANDVTVQCDQIGVLELRGILNLVCNLQEALFMVLESQIPFFNHLPVNARGRDFVIGDLHGMFDLLMSHLDDHSFDPSVDRVFSVGDLVDRGPDSIKCLSLIKHPWFYAVRGNHEQTIISLSKKIYSDPDEDLVRIIRKGGGDWVFSNERLSDIFFEALPLMESLPLAIQVGSGEVGFGVVHADMGGFDCWDSLVEWFRLRGSQDGWADFVNTNQFNDKKTEPILGSLLYGRSTLKKLLRGLINPESALITGVDRVFFGHTVVNEPIRFANRFYIDTCAHEYHRLTFLNVFSEFGDLRAA